MNSLSNLSSSRLRQAAAIQERIEALKAELNQILGDSAPAAAGAAVAPSKAPKKRRMSAAGRAAIAAGARARWAKIKGTPATASPKRKRKMSAAAKALLSAAAKARWKKAKALGKSRL
jgi:hypothetical protein